MYKLINDTLTNKATCVLLNGCTSIPFDPANTDAQQFARWLLEGNKPEPAAEGELVTDEWVAETIALLLPNG